MEGTRLLKQQPPVPASSLCIPLIPSLPLPLCSSIHPLFIPLRLSLAPTSLYLFCLSSSVPSRKHAHVLKDQRGHLVFPPRFPGACLVTAAPDSWPVALPDIPAKRAALTSAQRSARAYVHLLQHPPMTRRLTQTRIQIHT